ncbi:MAG: HD domain-containing protein [Planctomycetes bacterium]|nr:HD domain-containing protein [Planctomycetota bacterium]
MTATRTPPTVNLRKSYVPVPADIFEAECVLTFSLYARPNGGAIECVCHQSESLDQRQLQALKADSVRVFYVDTAEHRAYQQFAESALGNIVDRDDLPAGKKVEICYSTTRELIREAFESSNLEQVVDTHRETWVNNMVTLICSDEAALDSMVGMLSHDYYTYTHMVNVSVMVTALAYRLGQRDKDTLRQLASGGLLHDIGKTRVNPDTLNKVGRLTPQEWDELKQHPDLGLQFLLSRPGIKPMELMMVHQHHEKLDGGGYPQGLVGREITAEAQMTAVVDIYDALTSKRPYRKAMPHEQAVAILKEEAAAKTNREMTMAWIATVERIRAQEQRHD